jgi:hypothetical protein
MGGRGGAVRQRKWGGGDCVRTVDCSVVDPVVDGAEALLAEVGKLLHTFGVADVADGVEEAALGMLFLHSITSELTIHARHSQHLNRKDG